MCQLTEAQDREINEHNASSCIPYVLGYVQALLVSGKLPTGTAWYGSQFETGFNNALRDIAKGVVELHDVDLHEHIQCLIELGVFPLAAKQ
jgi:hypothetical protein